MRKKICILIFLIISSICQAAITWEYDSPLTVTETITDIGGGDYQYEYSFENVDTSPIWMFGVYLKFDATPDSTFDIEPTTEPGGWWVGPYYFLIEQYEPVFDGRNLDSNITGLINSSNEAGAGGNPVVSITSGEFASGFSFMSSVYDATPKYYFYCAIGTEAPWESESGKVTAVGTTVPEPTTISLLGIGALAFRSRRR